MGLIEAILGSGLLITAGGWLIQMGSHNKTHEMLAGEINAIKKCMDKLEDRQDIQEDKQQSSEVNQATILTELKYIRIQIDKLASQGH